MILALLLASSATLVGTVRDSQKHPLPSTTVHLLLAGAVDSKTVTDQQGLYRFANVPPGLYSVSAELANFTPKSSAEFKLQTDETKTLDITLEPADNNPSFFDKPQYTVAGVTDNTYRGGHGSDTVLRSSEALAKATASLGDDSSPVTLDGAESERAVRSLANSDPQSFSANYKLGAFLLRQSKCQDALPYLQRASNIRIQDAGVYHLLGDANECLGQSLAAVHYYEHAVELQPAEPYIFDLGTELLTHLAHEAAVANFSRGIALFPKSTRMLLGLAVSLYSRGLYDQAAQYFFEACDVNPPDPGPYMFLGKLQRSEITLAPGYISRLQRFLQLQPDNKWANYYYAVTIWKQRSVDKDDEIAGKAKWLLNKAIQLSPDFAEAYLQMGTVESDESDIPPAIAAYQTAIKLDPHMEEPHYRLAQLYKLQRENDLSRKELEKYDRLSKQNAREVELQRSEVQRFVLALRTQPE